MGFQSFQLFSSVVASLAYCGIAAAAPFPVTSASFLAQPEKGYFWSPAGFVLGIHDTGWKMELVPLSKKSHAEAKTPLESIDYTHRNFPKARFNVRVEQFKTDMTLESYAKKWSKEYHPYGFSLLGTRPFEHDEDRGLVYDLVSKNHPVQIRQVVFVKKDRAAILTCTDDKVSFSQSLKDCNRMVRRFSWQKPSEEPPTLQ